MGSQGSLGGIPGYLGGTDGTLGPMGPGPQGPWASRTPINDAPVKRKFRIPVPAAGCRAGHFSDFFFRKNSKNCSTDPRDQKKIRTKNYKKS